MRQCFSSERSKLTVLAAFADEARRRRRGAVEECRE